MKGSKFSLLAIAIACGLALGTGAWLLKSSGRSGTPVESSSRPGAPLGMEHESPPPAHPLPPITLSDADALARTEPVQEAISGEGLPVSVPSVLADFWGPLWPDIEDYMRNELPHFLEMNLRPDQLPPPWEEVEPVLADLLAAAIQEQRDRIPIMINSEIGMPWPEPLTIKALIERGFESKDLDEGAVVRAHVGGETLLREVQAGRNDLVAAFHSSCLQLLQTGRYHKSLYFMNGTVMDLLGIDWRRSSWPFTFLHEGYWVSFRVYKDEHPELQIMGDELARLVFYCDAALSRAISQR